MLINLRTSDSSPMDESVRTSFAGARETLDGARHNLVDGLRAGFFLTTTTSSDEDEDEDESESSVASTAEYSSGIENNSPLARSCLWSRDPTFSGLDVFGFTTNSVMFFWLSRRHPSF